MKYAVIEVQECTRLRAWTHEVEADSPEEAQRLAADGLGKLLDDADPVGDEEFGQSGFAVVENGNESGARQAALDKLLAAQGAEGASSA